jgi:hypothetical protein
MDGKSDGESRNDLTGFWCSKPVSLAGLVTALFFGALCVPDLLRAMFMSGGGH